MITLPKQVTIAVYLLFVYTVVSSGITDDWRKSGSYAGFDWQATSGSQETTGNPSDSRTSPGLIGDPSKVSSTDIGNALAGICAPNSILREASGTASGCSSCPKGSGFQDEQQVQWHLKHALSGHFTSSGEESIILSGEGCEPHSRNFGGTFVFLFKHGQLRFLKYNGSIITDRCHKVRVGEGLDSLVCQSAWGGQGYLNSFIYQVVFDDQGSGRTIPLFETRDSTFTCGENVQGERAGPVQQSRLQSVNFDERDRRKPSFSVVVTLGNKELTQAERETCKESLKKSNYHNAFVSIAITEYRIDFSLDGPEFKAAPSSEVTLKLFAKPALPN